MAGAKEPSPGLVHRLKGASAEKRKEVSFEFLENKEASILREMKKELEGLKEIYKKVKAEGVKEGIDKVGSLFSQLVNNRGERITLRQAQAAQKVAGAEVAQNLEALRRDFMCKIDGASVAIEAGGEGNCRQTNANIEW